MAGEIQRTLKIPGLALGPFQRLGLVDRLAA
jgi:hypothetical protein